MMINLLSQIIDRSAAQYPDHEAFRFEGEGLTYRELVRLSNGLAHLLIEQGVQRGDRVGIYLNKSLETAIAIYGIWKAGGAYVPLDPNSPVSRLAFVIEDCSIHYLITQKSKRSCLPDLLQGGSMLTCLIGLPDGLLNKIVPMLSETVRTVSWEAVQYNATDTLPVVSVMEQDLAYIMYTSGSTGTPKGIMHTHQSGLSYARMAATLYGLNQSDRLGNHSPLHFDMSTFDYFAGPLAGATTVIIPEAHTKMPASLSQLVEDEALTIWYSVPFALIQLLLRGALNQRDLSALRWVMFGGEPYPTKYMYALMEKLPQARFCNVYGPAEINQCSFYHVPPLASGETIPDEVAPIGKIWANAEERVLDEEDRVVALGEVGELVVCTPTMMTAYWKRPDLNAIAFFHETLGDKTAIFYRTGDLVQQRPDGYYQFVGRKDRQVKLRGYRVELDEVEAVLITHDQVETAAVYEVSYDEGEHTIEAVVILTMGSRLGCSDLLRYASERLPRYAVPQRIEIATSYPLTGTGKIDRRALQQQVLKRLQSSTAAPR